MTPLTPQTPLHRALRFVHIHCSPFFPQISFSPACNNSFLFGLKKKISVLPQTHIRRELHVLLCAHPPPFSLFLDDLAPPFGAFLLLHYLSEGERGALVFSRGQAPPRNRIPVSSAHSHLFSPCYDMKCPPFVPDSREYIRDVILFFFLYLPLSPRMLLSLPLTPYSPLCNHLPSPSTVNHSCIIQGDDLLLDDATSLSSFFCSPSFFFFLFFFFYVLRALDLRVLRRSAAPGQKHLRSALPLLFCKGFLVALLKVSTLLLMMLAVSPGKGKSTTAMLSLLLELLLLLISPPCGFSTVSPLHPPPLFPLQCPAHMSADTFLIKTIGANTCSQIRHPSATPI